VADCGTQTFCLDGNCFDAGHANDADFAQVVAAMEALREAGMYLDEAPSPCSTAAPASAPTSCSAW
jgi:replicative DNA helicase